MKRSLTTLAFLLISICVFAQKAEMAIAKVKYNLIHIRDTNNRSKPYTEEMLLLIGKNASMFTSNLKVTQNINFRKQVNEQVRNNGGSLDGLHIDGSKRKRTIGEDFYFFNTENKLYTLEPLGTNYLTEEDIPKIGWNIIKDTLSISGIKCQKAMANFKGRKWIAWFAPDMPFQNGPWKLTGLPGLIVEAYDEKKEVQFLFGGFEMVDPKDFSVKTNKSDMQLETELIGKEISIPNNAVKTTREELNRLKAARAKDPIGFANAQMAAMGLGSFKRVSGPSTTPTNNINTFNNPIELKDK